MSKPQKGDRFGRWSLLTDPFLVLHANGKRYRFVIAKCDCVLATERRVMLTTLVRGKSRSCGCLALERMKEASTKHGYIKHPLYSQWRGMIARCRHRNHKSFRYYGERGILVCEEWNEFLPFMEWALSNGWEPGLTIDRRNTNGHYHPDNCRFRTTKQQCNNKRNNRHLTAFGETKTVSEWVDDPRCKTTYNTIRDRIDLLSWPPEKAISTPTRHPSRKAI